MFLEPGHSVRSVDNTLEGFPAQILQGFGLKSLRRILNEVMQAFVSLSALERFCDRRAGPLMLGQIYNAWSIGLTEPRRGIELETDDIVSRMAGSLVYGVPRFR